MATKTKAAAKTAPAKKAAPVAKKAAAKTALHHPSHPPVKAAAKVPAKKAPAKPAVTQPEYSAPAEPASLPDLTSLNWTISNKPFKRSRSSEDSPIAQIVAALPLGTPISSPSGQLQTITKYAKAIGATVTSVVDKDGPKGPDGSPLNRIWIKRAMTPDEQKDTGEIPDLPQ